MRDYRNIWSEWGYSLMDTIDLKSGPDPDFKVEAFTIKDGKFIPRKREIGAPFIYTDRYAQLFHRIQGTYNPLYLHFETEIVWPTNFRRNIVGQVIGKLIFLNATRAKERENYGFYTGGFYGGWDRRFDYRPSPRWKDGYGYLLQWEVPGRCI